jgi:hypothetical protein
MEINSLKIYIAAYLYKGFCKRQIYLCHCEISSYHSIELQSVNTLHEIALYSKSRLSEQSFVSVYDLSMDNDNIWLCICERSAYIKETFYD